jgi:hypothetical protein
MCLSILVFISLGGFVTFLVGIANIPNTYPDQSLTDSAEQQTSKLNEYRLRSQPFLLCMIGLGITLLGPLLFYINHCCKKRVRPLPVKIDIVHPPV